MKEKETYKKAREILERFSNGVDFHITPPATPSHNTTMYPQTPFVNNTLISQKLPGTTLIHRKDKQSHEQNLNTTLNPNLNATISNRPGSSASMVSGMSQSNLVSQQIPTQTLGPAHQQQLAAPPLALAASIQARTILPRPISIPNRTFFDKLLDFIIGEGPNNR